MMLLSEILKDCPIKSLSGPETVEITGLCFDSRKVQPGCGFFALGGLVHDGHAFVAEAVQRGARAVISERECTLPEGRAGVVVANARQTMAIAARNYYDDPTEDMPVVGVTGTNGKTTVSYLLETILQRAGLTPAVVGTVDYRYRDQQHPAPYTTPEAPELLAHIADFRRQGARSLVLEVSSHALDQYRVDGLHFRVGVFTNLTPEHLDYHHDMDRYFQSKCRLFQELLSRDGGRAVVNISDPYGERLVQQVSGALTCGRTRSAAVHPLQLEVNLAGIRGRVQTPEGPIQVVSPLLGEYNVENLLCAVAAAIALQLPVSAIEAGLTTAPQVPGRLEKVDNARDAVILVDYAHTGDALKRVLEAMQALRPGRLLTVFGCGGDRDPGKRPVMGEVAGRFSDIALVTSDNPRTEDPLKIIEDVKRGLARVHDREWTLAEARKAESPGYLVIPDRRQAIRTAVSLLQAGDLLLVAGKGHEDYQILGTKRIHFDDREELRLALAAGGSHE